MFSNKPEFIDPAEKNLIYYYNRGKTKKRLTKKKDHSHKKRFLIFKTKTGKFLLIFFYIILISYIFLNPWKKKYKINSYTYETKKIKIVLSEILSIKNKKIDAQVLLINKLPKPLTLTLSSLNFFLLNKKNNIIQEKKILIHKIFLNTKSLQNFSVSFNHRKKAYKIITNFSINKKQIKLEKKISKK